MSDMKVKLDGLGGGAAMDRFEEEMNKVISNIVGPNTSHKTKRQVTLTVSISPNEERNQCVMEISCVSKLAPIKSVDSVLAIGIDSHGSVHAEEWVPKQMGLFDTSTAEDRTLERAPGKIVAMGSRQ